jgi:hypothetical protein
VQTAVYVSISRIKVSAKECGGSIYEHSRQKSSVTRSAEAAVYVSMAGKKIKCKEWRQRFIACDRRVNLQGMWRQQYM